MDKNELFSKEALEKLRSPDKLDLLLPVTSPVSWVALGSVAILVISVVLWSILGSMVTKVNGVGLLLDPKGIIRVINPEEGWVSQVNIKPGDRVCENNLMIRLRNPSLAIQQNDAFNSMENALSKEDVTDNVAKHDSLDLRKDLSTNFLSFCDGIVNEVNVKTGDFVGPGYTLATIRRTGGQDGLKGVFYVRATEGKKILPGMMLQLLPSGFDNTDDGQLMAVVREVSEYPVSSYYVLSQVGNESTADYIMSSLDNAVMEVRFDLIEDKTNNTGYLWTTVRDSKKPLTAGSMVTGFAVTDRKPPIEIVFYKISSWLRTR